MQLQDTLYEMLLTAGGTAVVCGALVASLWRVFTSSLLEKFKSSQAQQLEEFKSAQARPREQFRSEVQLNAARVARYDTHQFGVYQEVWDKLADLRVAADRLWDRASDRNIQEF